MLLKSLISLKISKGIVPRWSAITKSTTGVRSFNLKRCYHCVSTGQRPLINTNDQRNKDNIFIQSQLQSRRHLFIEIQDTPNPNSLKFLPQRVILKEDDQPRDFPTTKSTVDCSLASQLHQVEGVLGVYIGRDFITVSKSEEVSWSSIDSEVRSLLMEYFSVNQCVHMLTSKPPSLHQQSSSSSTTTAAKLNDGEEEENEDEVVEMIKELIETKIRPTVQEDGGDIVYVGFEEGIVKVKLQGSCTTCPSSQVTLKRGVQNMLQFYVPEVMGVIQVEDEKDDLSAKEFEKFDGSLDKDTKEN